MKVLYDHQIFGLQDFGGISRYYYELLKRQRGCAELSLAQSNNEYVRADMELASQVAPKPLPRRYSKLERIVVPKKIRNRVPGARENMKCTSAKLKEGGFDLFHPTYYDPYFLDGLQGRPFVLTVHDMIHELYPEYFHLTDSVSADKRKLVEKAAHIITVSATTKRDLVNIHGIEESRITVVYHGSSLNSEGPEGNLQLPGKFLLMVGSRASYKNCYFALQALSKLFKRIPELSVVFAGGGPFSGGEQGYFSTLGLSGRIHYYPAGNSALRMLYKRAEAFIFPSLYEGFGIPLLEAFSCGCPVLSSNTAALREVAADAALYFEPKDLHAMESAVERILCESALRERLRVSGYERLSQFSWERCAKETTVVYEKVLGL